MQQILSIACCTAWHVKEGRERETDTPMGSKAPEGAGQEGHVKDIKSLAVLKGANSNRQH
jgi:hypothetical protein